MPDKPLNTVALPGKPKPTPGSLLSRYQYGRRAPQTLAGGRAVGPARAPGGVGDAPGRAAGVAEPIRHDGGRGVRGAGAGSPLVRAGGDRNAAGRADVSAGGGELSRHGLPAG